ncbi:MAG: twin-arginine translocase subunit TatC [Candidatus Aminicenantes bacterium]|nr:twin-arginine translocase subunit TatC [Candidatus Aminicenantes bacterium]
MNDSPGSSPPQDPSASETQAAEDAGQETVPASGSPPPPSDPPTPVASAEAEDDPDSPDEEELGAKMTFLEHLDELRKRILWSAIAVAVAFIGCWVFREPIFEFLSIPIKNAGIEKLTYIKPTEPFTIYLKVCFVAAVFLAAPAILSQVWLFIAPGLYQREKRYVIPFLVSSTALVLLGGTFAYYIILPTALDFLINQFGSAFQPMVTALEYFNFEVIIILGMGAIFQLPVIVAFLSMFGLITPGFLWRNFRYAFLLMVMVAAVVSPTTDAINLFLWSGPMVLLYLVSIVISWVFKRRAEKRAGL